MFFPCALVSHVVRSVKSATQSSDVLVPLTEGFARSQYATIGIPFGPFCLADLDPHAGHCWEHLVLLFLCLGFWSLVCNLQPTLQPIRDYAEAHAGPRVLLSLCSHNLRSASAQVCNSFAPQDSNYTESEASSKY